METMSSKIFTFATVDYFIAAVIAIITRDLNIIIHKRKEFHLRCKSRLKTANSRTLYYSISIASFSIVLSGEVEKNQEMYRVQQQKS